MSPVYIYELTPVWAAQMSYQDNFVMNNGRVAVGKLCNKQVIPLFSTNKVNLYDTKLNPQKLNCRWV